MWYSYKYILVVHVNTVSSPSLIKSLGPLVQYLSELQCRVSNEKTLLLFAEYIAPLHVQDDMLSHYLFNSFTHH